MSGINVVWRITDYKKGIAFYVGKKHQVRRYRMDNPNNDGIRVEEITWVYKRELIKLLNDSIHFMI